MKIGPPLVTNGLVLLYEFASRNSYSGTGTSIFDRSGFKNNGTISNSPTFVNLGSYGYFSFNGAATPAQLISGGNNSTVQFNAGTAVVWAYATNANSAATGYMILGKPNAWGIHVVSNKLQIYDYGNAIFRDTNVTIGNSTWNHIAITFTTSTGLPSNNCIVYVNGVAVLTTTLRNSSQASNIAIGSDGSGNQKFTGFVSTVTLYDRVLSATEILQNYNAKKTRFGKR